MKILAVSGSLRNASLNTLLLRTAAQLAPAGVEVQLFHGIGALPHFNPDLAELRQSAVREWQDAVQAADGILFSTPEYAHGIPGSLKNALDWLVGGIEMVGKPVALLNASPWSLHAPASLMETLRTMSAVVVDVAEINVTLRGALQPGFDPLQEPQLTEPIRTGLTTFVATIRARRSGALA